MVVQRRHIKNHFYQLKGNTDRLSQSGLGRNGLMEGTNKALPTPAKGNTPRQSQSGPGSNVCTQESKRYLLHQLR